MRLPSCISPCARRKINKASSVILPNPPEQQHQICYETQVSLLNLSGNFEFHRDQFCNFLLQINKLDYPELKQSARKQFHFIFTCICIFCACMQPTLCLYVLLWTLLGHLHRKLNVFKLGAASPCSKQSAWTMLLFAVYIYKWKWIIFTNRNSIVSYQTKFGCCSAPLWTLGSLHPVFFPGLHITSAVP